MGQLARSAKTFSRIAPHVTLTDARHVIAVSKIQMVNVRGVPKVMGESFGRTATNTIASGARHKIVLHVREVHARNAAMERFSPMILNRTRAIVRLTHRFPNVRHSTRHHALDAMMDIILMLNMVSHMVRQVIAGHAKK